MSFLSGIASTPSSQIPASLSKASKALTHTLPLSTWNLGKSFLNSKFTKVTALGFILLLAGRKFGVDFLRRKIDIENLQKFEEFDPVRERILPVLFVLLNVEAVVLTLLVKNIVENRGKKLTPLVEKFFSKTLPKTSCGLFLLGFTANRLAKNALRAERLRREKLDEAAVGSVEIDACVNNGVINLFKLLNGSKDKDSNSFFLAPNLIPHFITLYCAATPEVRKELRTLLNLPESDRSTKAIEPYQKWLDPKSYEGCRKNWTGITRNVVLTATKGELKLDNGVRDCLPLEANRIQFSSPEGLADEANKWIEEKTDGKIQDLVKVLSENTVFLMAVASVFEGMWKYPFKDCGKKEFTNSNGSRSEIPYMRLGTDVLKEGWDNAFGMNILQLPMNNLVDMYLVQSGPMVRANKRKESKRVRKYLEDNEGFLKFLNDKKGAQALEESKGLTITVPKFSLEDDVDLMELHQPLMDAIKKSDWNGLFSEEDREDLTDPIKLEKMKSRTIIEVREDGVTGFGATFTACGRQSCPPTFWVSGPFGVVLVDSASYTILGMGQVNNLSHMKK